MGAFFSKAVHRIRKIREFIEESDSFIYVVATGLFGGLFTLGLLYRLRILYMIQVDTAFTVSRTPGLLFLKGLFNESLFALLTAVLFWAVLAGIIYLVRREPGRALKTAFIVLASVIAFGAAFIYNTSYHFWVSMNTGLTRDLIFEAAATTRIEEAARFLKPADAIFFLAPLAVLWLYLLGRRFVVWRNRLSVGLAALAALVYAVHSLFAATTVEGGMSSAPVNYTIASFFERNNWNASETFGGKTNGRTDQHRSVELIDGKFVTGGGGSESPGVHYAQRTRWNVLYIVMESIGREYIFNTSKGNPMPMPFYHDLSKKGLFLDYHFSVGNTSPRSLYSMLSGLYPSPRVQMFCTRPDVKIPSLRNFLGDGYDAFLVTPGSLDWFFPKGFMRNSGFKDILGFKEVEGRVIRDSYGKNDIDVVDFFIRRLKKSGNGPFLAVYYSFAAHWPYVDFGEEYRIFKNTENRLSRYYNNINMLDRQIRKIFDYLTEAGLIDKTIVVILSDHGEAFNQHPGVWIHSRDSYNENFRVPALLYQPKLFTPARVTVPTTHADIVPTLLDAMGIRYNRRLVQGESLLKNRLRRKYIFLFGNENTITTVGADRIKLQYSFRDKACWVFDLNKDPGELKKLPCDGHDEQLQAMMFYHQYQPKILEEYNESLKNGTDFHGERHLFAK